MEKARCETASPSFLPIPPKTDTPYKGRHVLILWDSMKAPEDVWGEITRGGEGKDVNPFLYVGAHGVRWQDSTLGLFHMRARWMNSQTGRFTQRDLLMGDARQPQTLNRYIYVVNNPVLNIDPSGLIFVTPHPTDECTLTMHSAIATLLKRLHTRPSCVAAFARLKCGDIIQILGNKMPPPSLSAGPLPPGKPGGYIPGTNAIRIGENYCYKENYYYVARSLCHELAHWCAWMRLGRHSTAAEPSEGNCVEKECFDDM